MTTEYDGRKSQARRDMLDAQAGPSEATPVAIGFGNGQADLTMHAYRKTVLTYATRIDEPFGVWTNEGRMEGKAGDYLAVGPAGEMYPIDKAVFAASYEQVVDPLDEADRPHLALRRVGGGPLHPRPRP